MSREERRARAREERRLERERAEARVDHTPLERERATPKEFMSEVRGELRKVAWPTRSQVFTYTITVLFITAVLAVLIWGMDTLLKEAATRFL